MSRTGRLGFFGYTFVSGVLTGAAGLAFDVAQIHGSLTIAVRCLFLLVTAAGGWIAIATCVRRFHDLGWSGWWVVLTPVPVVGWIQAALLASMPGQRSENRYGNSYWKA